MGDDEIDLEKIYNDFFPKIYNYIFYRLLQREAAEDLVSQIFLKITEHIGDYNSKKASISTWIWVITENTLKDFYRTQKKSVLLKDKDLVDDGRFSICFEEQYEMIVSEKRRAFFKALSYLSERDRIIVYYKSYYGMSYKDLSEKLNINESTLSSAYMRAKEKLRSFLQEELDNSLI